MAASKAKAPAPAPETPASTPETAQVAPAVAVPPKKKSNKTLWIVLALVAFFFIVIPGLIFTAGAIWLNNNASDKIAENAVEGLLENASGGNVDINTSDGSFSVQSEDGESSFSAGDNQKIPDDFPKNEIPYLKEDKVTFVFTTTSEGKKNWSVSTTVSEDYETAKSFFGDKIVEPDYTDVSSYGFGESQTYYGVKGGYGVSVTITKPSETTPDTGVTYLVSEE